MHICELTVGSNVEALVTACETCERSRLKISLLHSEDFDLQLHKQSHCQGNAIVLGAKPAKGARGGGGGTPRCLPFQARNGDV